MLILKVGDRIHYEYSDIAKIGPKELQVFAEFKGDAVIESMSGFEGLRIVTLVTDDGRRMDVAERHIKRVYPPSPAPEATSAPKYTAHQHSVVETSATLAAAASGSLEGYESATLDTLAEWLRWRIEDGWEGSFITRTKSYDASVREMAREALRLYAQPQTDDTSEYSVFVTCATPVAISGMESSPLRCAERIARQLVLMADVSSPLKIVVTNKRLDMSWEYEVSVVAQTGAASCRLVGGSAPK